MKAKQLKRRQLAFCAGMLVYGAGVWLLLSFGTPRLVVWSLGLESLVSTTAALAALCLLCTRDSLKSIGFWPR